MTSIVITNSVADMYDQNQIEGVIALDANSDSNAAAFKDLLDTTSFNKIYFNSDTTEHINEYINYLIDNKMNSDEHEIYISESCPECMNVWKEFVA